MLPIAYIPVLFLAASVPGTEYLECVDLFNFAKKKKMPCRKFYNISILQVRKRRSLEIKCFAQEDDEESVKEKGVKCRHLPIELTFFITLPC